MNRFTVRALSRLVALGAMLAWAGPGVAQSDMPAVARSAVSPPVLEAKSWVLMDYGSGWVLAVENPHLRIEPASLSKLMTAYVVFRELRKGSLSLDTLVHISEKAWRTEGSRMFVDLNTRVSVEDLLQGLIVQSGNDAAVALAEQVAGSEAAFAELMNRTAAELGLNNSHFENSTGLPAENHYSTAYDLSVLVRAIIRDYSEYYDWYSQKEFTFNGITQHNRNVLLWRDESVDGVKTGHTSTAGYCLVGSALRDGMRLIATVVGTDSRSYRADAVHSLLKFGYAAYETRNLYTPDTPVVQVSVFKGAESVLPVGPDREVTVTLPRGAFDGLQAQVTVADNQVAPVAAGQSIGTVSFSYQGEPVSQFSLVAMHTVPEGAWWRRIIDTVRLWFQ